MYLIPFFKKEEYTLSGNHLLKIVLFLANGGTSFLSDVPESQIESFCEDNGFTVNQMFSTKNAVFLEVDTKKTDISSYYNYFEAYKTKNECWRTFVLVVSNELKDVWNVNEFFKETPFYTVLLDIVNKKKVV